MFLSGTLLPRTLLCVRVAIMTALGTFVLAASAQAAEPAPAETTPAPVTEPAPEASSRGEATETGTEGTPPVEAVTETSSESERPVETVAEHAPAELTTPVETVTEQAPAELTTPVETVTEQAPAEPVSPVEAVKEPEPDPTPPATEAAAPVTPTSENGKEAAPTQTLAEEVAVTSTTSAAPQDAGGPGAPMVLPVTPDSSTLSDSLTMALTGEAELQPTTSASRSSRAPAPVQLSAAQRAADLTCELSGLSSPDTDDCTAGWLAGQSLSSTSPAYLTTAAAAARAGTPAGEGEGGAMGASHSVTPPPAPAPSGAFGGSGASGSGIAPTGFFALSGHLRLVAPRAMRRLWLSFQPWRTAFFVLIPERPG